MRSDRTYTHRKNKERVLLAWIQRQCIICKKFLKKKQILYCDKCKKKMFKVYNKRARETEFGKIFHSFNMYVYRHIDELEVGDYI
jgi:hypothetical protein